MRNNVYKWFMTICLKLSSLICTQQCRIFIPNYVAYLMYNNKLYGSFSMLKYTTLSLRVLRKYAHTTSVMFKIFQFKAFNMSMDKPIYSSYILWLNKHEPNTTVQHNNSTFFLSAYICIKLVTDNVFSLNLPQHNNSTCMLLFTQLCYLHC